MKKLRITILEVENGYVVFDDDPSRLAFSGNKWVASNIEQLKNLVQDLASELLTDHRKDEE